MRYLPDAYPPARTARARQFVARPLAPLITPNHPRYALYCALAVRMGVVPPSLSDFEGRNYLKKEKKINEIDRDFEAGSS